MKKLWAIFHRERAFAAPRLSVRKGAVRKDVSAPAAALAAENIRCARFAAAPAAVEERRVSPLRAAAGVGLDEMIASLSRLKGLNVAERELFSRERA